MEFVHVGFMDGQRGMAALGHLKGSLRHGQVETALPDLQDHRLPGLLQFQFSGLQAQLHQTVTGADAETGEHGLGRGHLPISNRLNRVSECIPLRLSK